MAFYIHMRKQEENQDFAIYIFSTTISKGSKAQEKSGVIRLSKKDGSAEILQAIEGDERGVYSIRAHVKLRKHWQEGYFPDVTCYAA